MARLQSNVQSTSLSLLDYIPQRSPHLRRPDHFKPFADLVEQALEALRGNADPVRGCLSSPPQHGKTMLIIHALLLVAELFPGSKSVYVSYGVARAHEISDVTRWLAEACGHRVEGNKDCWHLENGSTIYWTGIGGPLTGKTIDALAVIDDPHKDREEADSAVMRQKVVSWYESVLTTRLHSKSSVIVVQTRWHPEDLYGTLAKRRGWFSVNLPALNDGTDENRAEGEALAEWLHSRVKLEGIRAGGSDEVSAYEWFSLYMGQPRPRGANIFGDPAHYLELPKAYRVAYGIDLAYTEKTYADWSVAVRLFVVGPVCYVHDVKRKQVEAPKFADILKTLQKEHPGRMIWHCSGTEKGSGQFMQKLIGPKLQLQQTTKDKFQRAQPAAAAWNADPPRILLPHPDKFHNDWYDPFVKELRDFTGVDDLRDDQVDALASAYTVATRRSELGVVTQDLGF